MTWRERTEVEQAKRTLVESRRGRGVVSSWRKGVRKNRWSVYTVIE
jgi:hypothetical protein